MYVFLSKEGQGSKIKHTQAQMSTRPRFEGNVQQALRRVFFTAEFILSGGPLLS